MRTLRILKTLRPLRTLRPKQTFILLTVSFKNVLRHIAFNVMTCIDYCFTVCPNNDIIFSLTGPTIDSPDDPYVLVGTAHCNYICKDRDSGNVLETCCCRPESNPASCQKVKQKN